MLHWGIHKTSDHLTDHLNNLTLGQITSFFIKPTNTCYCISRIISSICNLSKLFLTFSSFSVFTHFLLHPHSMMNQTESQRQRETLSKWSWFAAHLQHHWHNPPRGPVIHWADNLICDRLRWEHILQLLTKHCKITCLVLKPILWR